MADKLNAKMFKARIMPTIFTYISASFKGWISPLARVVKVPNDQYIARIY